MDVSVILYTSATGFTRRYARMLEEETGLAAYELGSPAAPGRGAPALYLGWLCAGGIKGFRRARSRYDLRAVCAVGMAPPAEGLLDRLRSGNRTDPLPLFYLRGGYAPERLPAPYRLMMVPMARLVRRAPAGTPEERAMQSAFIHGGDWVSRDALAPVLSWLKG